jgi:hypothetical protein
VSRIAIGKGKRRGRGKEEGNRGKQQREKGRGKQADGRGGRGAWGRG